VISKLSNLNYGVELIFILSFFVNNCYVVLPNDKLIRKYAVYFTILFSEKILFI